MTLPQSSLQIISQDYRKAEVTCLFVHHRQTDEEINIWTVFELVPSEQPSSEMLADRTSHYLRRVSVNAAYTLYITRLVNLNVQDAIRKYEQAEQGFSLDFDNLQAAITVPYTLQQEPPAYHPLLIDGSTEKTIGRILPARRTSLRVWSKLNTDKQWLGTYPQALFEKLAQFSVSHLGFDLAALREHIGNVYLCACNPYLRKWDTTLVDQEKDLLVSFYEREGHTIVGSQLVIEEERAGNLGFTLILPVTSNRMRVFLPYFPDALHKKMFDPRGNLLEHSIGVFLNIDFTMAVQENVLNLRMQTSDGVDEYRIPKRITAARTRVGHYDRSTAHYLRNALHQRRFQELEANKEFIFFPSEAASAQKAQQVVRDLLNQANHRCIILDPYFGAGDLRYAFVIENISIPVQIISSAQFLNEKINREDPASGRYAQQLADGIRQYRQQYPRQTIQCKVLRGKKSPLHDRYLVIDDQVYLLGSSLNEFGSRATTLIRVPTPQPMVEQALTWWADDSSCPYLDDYLTQTEA